MSRNADIPRRNRMFARWCELRSFLALATEEGISQNGAYQIVRRHPDYKAAARDAPAYVGPHDEAVRAAWLTDAAEKIGERLGISKNSVISIAHRMNLPAKQPRRPKLDDAAEKERVEKLRAAVKERRAEELRMKRLAATPRPIEAPKPVTQEAPMIIAAPQQIPMPLPRPTAFAALERIVAPVSALPLPAFRACQWPTNDGERNRWTFCGCADVEPGKPYCLAHCRDAYVGYQRREAA